MFVFTPITLGDGSKKIIVEIYVRVFCQDVVHITQWNIIQSLNEWNDATGSNMDGLRECYTEWSKLDKEKYHMILPVCRIYWKWYKWIYLQNTHRLTGLRELTYGYGRGQAGEKDS